MDNGIWFRTVVLLGLYASYIIYLMVKSIIEKRKRGDNA